MTQNKYERSAGAIALAAASGTRVIGENGVYAADHVICNICDGCGLKGGEVCPNCGGHGVFAGVKAVTGFEKGLSRR